MAYEICYDKLMWVRKVIEKIFITKTGNIVILQRPNLPISAWIIAKIAEHITHEPVIKEGLAQTSVAFLLIWSVLELLQGVNYFRRILGLFILLGIIMQHFA